MSAVGQICKPLKSRHFVFFVNRMERFCPHLSAGETRPRPKAGENGPGMRFQVRTAAQACAGRVRPNASHRPETFLPLSPESRRAYAAGYAIGFAIGSRSQWHGPTYPREGAACRGVRTAPCFLSFANCSHFLQEPRLRSHLTKY